MSKLGVMGWLLAGAVALAATGRTQGQVREPGPSEIREPGEALTAKTFVLYQKQIKPQAGESRWLEVPWFVDLHAARQQAAAEGKPLFVYAAGSGTGIGAC